MAASIKIVENSDSENEDESPVLGNKKSTCSICVQKEARYTCPRCNIAYCSLDCYRHKKHEGCSESFYRDWVMDEMKEHVMRPEDRQKVLEMLSREHEQQEADSDDDDTPDLSERLEGLDLDRDAGEVWKRLTAGEREEFAHMLKDGRLANLVTIWTPWWMRQKSSIVQEAGGDQLPEGFPPHLSDIPDIHQLLKGVPSAEIKYNMVNVISAYAFVTRLHNGDHHENPLECAEELLKVCDVLKHNVNFPASTQAVQAVIQEVQKPGSGFVVPASFPIVLLGDVVRILQGPRLSPLSAVLSAVSDMAIVLKEANKELKGASGKKRRRKRSRRSEHPQPPRDGAEEERDETSLERQLFMAKKKATFLLSWTQRFGMCLSPLCAELSLELECQKSEAAETRSLQSAVEKGLQGGHLQPRPQSQHAAASITELS
ncbi:zinc finger HIT domain-containing protein 2-like [Babylonia areolata]|uniref:zinc finger HIT domain-containing protein 2-like n=1 Tax=Babylonia areolata TaxID=304850 RepID=UPI003FD10BCD